MERKLVHYDETRCDQCGALVDTYEKRSGGVELLLLLQPCGHISTATVRIGDETLTMSAGTKSQAESLAKRMIEEGTDPLVAEIAAHASLRMVPLTR